MRCEVSRNASMTWRSVAVERSTPCLHNSRMKIAGLYHLKKRPPLLPLYALFSSDPNHSSTFLGPASLSKPEALRRRALCSKLRSTCFNKGHISSGLNSSRQCSSPSLTRGHNWSAMCQDVLRQYQCNARLPPPRSDPTELNLKDFAALRFEDFTSSSKPAAGIMPNTLPYKRLHSPARFEQK